MVRNRSAWMIGVVALVAGLGLAAAAARAAEEKGVVGKWKLEYEPGDGQVRRPLLTIKKAGDDLKGEWLDGQEKGTIKDLKFKDGKLSFKLEAKYNGDPVSVTYEGEIKGDAIRGEGEWDYQGMTGTFGFEGKREAEKPKE
ncbi:hypothetical protein [Aquisphaera insulae]|uniref:hypothetical protein n=1 Tax=Aquisphaera insulae TaxID=2712864 RepID=UPI0013EC440B|nr:hypothetical protein [Aquisphaera insulae]